MFLTSPAVVVRVCSPLHTLQTSWWFWTGASLVQNGSMLSALVVHIPWPQDTLKSPTVNRAIEQESRSTKHWLWNPEAEFQIVPLGLEWEGALSEFLIESLWRFCLFSRKEYGGSWSFCHWVKAMPDPSLMPITKKNLINSHLAAAPALSSPAQGFSLLVPTLALRWQLLQLLSPHVWIDQETKYSLPSLGLRALYPSHPKHQRSPHWVEFGAPMTRSHPSSHRKSPQSHSWMEHQHSQAQNSAI